VIVVFFARMVMCLAHLNSLVMTPFVAELEKATEKSPSFFGIFTH